MKGVRKQVCTQCILDETVKDIWFDSVGKCKYCHIHDQLEESYSKLGDLDKALYDRIALIKRSGKGKDYDCIAGVSGGRDSTYTLLQAKKLGLRPLAVHFDNGWNTDISVSNVKKACDKLGVDLVTIVADWEEFKDLQRAFLKAGTPDADIPTDYAIYSTLYTIAAKEGIKYILNGHSYKTEGTSPISWTYMDPLYVSSVLKKYGRRRKIKSFPHMSLARLQYYIWVKRIREIRILEYIDYNKDRVDEELKAAVDWQYYGGHHHENHFTKFFQSYFLPTRFGIDKRKTELSALIRSGQRSREQALDVIKAGAYSYDQENVDYVIGKLDFSKKEWEQLMSQPILSHENYTTLLPLIKMLRGPINFATSIGVLPRILYLKYAS